MFRRTTAILLFVTLASGNAAATTLCASLSQGGADQTPERHCNMTHEISASMVCCRHKLPSLEPLSNEASSCCQMSAPLPDLPGTALPANSQQDFGLQTLAQLNSSDLVSPPALTHLFAGQVSMAVAFCPDHSDTYLLASTFRI